VSNYSLDQWAEAERALGAPVVANQVRFSLVHPRAADDLVPYAVFHDRLVVAYSPLGQGLLAGGGRPGGRDMRAISPDFRPGAQGRLAPLRATLGEIAATHGATPAQVALAWVIHHPNTVAIPGARTLEQLEENASAAEIELSDDEFAVLSTAARQAAERA
jgi:aryl-alcohol dehydrogenase-like predicted oxidoreductase